MSHRLNQRSLEAAKALVRAGKYVDKPWSFSAADGNAILGDPANWTEYGKWHLGLADGAPESASESGRQPTKADFAYPFGKDGVLYLSALRAIASRASAQGDGAIAEAASKLLEEAQAKQSDKAKASAKSPDEGKRIMFCAPVEIRAAAAEGDQPAGPPPFKMIAYTGVPMRLDGWKFPVVADLNGIEGLGQTVPAYFDHDKKQIVGHVTDTRIEDGNLIAEGVASGHGEAKENIVGSSKNGFPWQASVGATVLDHEFVPRGQTGQANGKVWPGPVNIARRTSLDEISFVSRGADTNTSARIAASAAGDSPMKKKFAAWMKARGFKASEMDADGISAAKALYQSQMKCSADDETDEDYDPATDTDPDEQPTKKGAKANAKTPKIRATAATAEPIDEPDPEPSADTKQAVEEVKREIRAAAVAERKRISTIQAKLDEYRPRIEAAKFGEIESKAIDEDWDADHVELACLRAARPETPKPTINASFGINVGAGVPQDEMPAILASAAAISSGVREKIAVEGLSDAAKQIAVSRQMRGLSLHKIMSVVAAASGMRFPVGNVDNGFIGDLLRNEQRLMIQAAGGGTGGYSTMSLSGITENILNKAMLQAYGDVPSVVDDIAFQTDTNDFKTFKRYRLTASGSMAPVGPTGELKSFSLQDESYANQVVTQGMIMNVGRDILINDDMGALTQIPTVIGREAALYRELQVFKTLTGNAGSFFGTGNKNSLTGAPSALSITSLTTSTQKFREQKDVNGRPVMVQPDRLLVPPALEAPALNLFNGANIIVGALGSTSAKSTEPNLNAHVGKYKPIVSPFLGAQSQIASLTDTAWYQLSNPSGGFAVVQIGYLRGQRTPIIERGEANFNTLGISMRCYYDFGVALHDFRCGVLNAGA